MKSKLILITFSLLSLLIFLLGSCNGNSGLNSLESVQELCVIRSDGSDLRVIANGGGYYTFLPDSNEILYTGGQSGLNGLYRINIDGSGNTQIINDLHSIWGFSVSPNNKNVLMPSSDGLYKMDLDSKVIRLILESDGRPIKNVAYSSNMTQIVFQSNYDIEVGSGSGGTHRLIKKETELTRYLSPGFIFGDSLVIYIEQAKKTDNPFNSLRVYSLIQGNDSVLISSDKLPVFSDYIDISRNDRILVNAGGPGPLDTIKIINPANNFKITNLDAGYNYSFTPDNNNILYLNSGNIYMINTEGTGKKLIYKESNSLASIGQPKLSYDGKYIIFGRNRQQK